MSKACGAAVYMSGDEMSFDRNWVGLHEGQDASLLATVDQTTATETKENVASAQQTSGAKFVLASGSSAHAPGGIHIAGPSGSHPAREAMGAHVATMHAG